MRTPAPRSLPSIRTELAAAISTATGHTYTALKLPFAPMQGRAGARPLPNAVGTTAPLTFLDGETSIQFGTGGSLYKCTLVGLHLHQSWTDPADWPSRPRGCA